VSTLKELEAKRLAIRKRMIALREELAPLAAKADNLREALYHAELDLTLVCDQLREAAQK
jgi:hypothetical protein